MKPTTSPLIIPLSTHEIQTGFSNLHEFGDPGIFIGKQTSPEGNVDDTYALVPRIYPSTAAQRVGNNLGLPIVQETCFQPTLAAAKLIRGLVDLAGIGVYDTERAISRLYGMFEDIRETRKAVRATAPIRLGSLDFVLDISLPAGTRQGEKGEILSPAVLTAKYDKPSQKAYCPRILSPAVRLSQSSK